MAERRLSRAGRVRSQSFNADERTVDLVWTTGAAVERFGWDGDVVEVLSLEPGAVRLDRLNRGAPFLNTHASYDLSDVIGTVVDGSARIEGGKGVATVKLSGAAADADTIGKIRDGVIRNISVGYIVHAYRDSEAEGVTTRLVTDWEPLEISAVPIPADAGAQIRSHGGLRRAALARRDLSRRVADIRRWARKVGLPKLGEKHVKAGTSADRFFEIITARLTTPPKEKQMAKHDRFQDAFKRGQREAELLLGRGKRDDDAPPSKEADDEDEDRDDDVCPTCGQAIDEDMRDDDDQDEDGGDASRDDDDGDDDRRRGYLSGRSGRVRHAAPAHRHVPASARHERSEPVPHSRRIERDDIERCAAEFRKLLGRR